MDKCCLCIPVKNGMKVLTVLMLLTNGSGIVFILSGLANASAFSAIVGFVNVAISGYVIYLLCSWMFGNSNHYDKESIENFLEKGLMINVLQTLLQCVVMAVFVSQNREASAIEAKDVAYQSCLVAQDNGTAMEQDCNVVG
jgi:hypothetical protein